MPSLPPPPCAAPWRPFWYGGGEAQAYQNVEERVFATDKERIEF
jgi:hypothetical protein